MFICGLVFGLGFCFVVAGNWWSLDDNATHRPWKGYSFERLVLKTNWSVNGLSISHSLWDRYHRGCMDVFGVVHVSCSTLGLKRNCFPCPHIGGMCKEARQWDNSPKRCSFGTGVFYDLRLVLWVKLSCYILLDLIKLSFIWVQLWNQSANLPTSEEIANWNKILLWRSSVHLRQPRILH